MFFRICIGSARYIRIGPTKNIPSLWLVGDIATARLSLFNETYRMWRLCKMTLAILQYWCELYMLYVYFRPKMAQEVLTHQYRCAIKLHWLHCNRKVNANIIQYALLYRTIALTTVYDEMYPMVGRGLFYAGKPLAPVFQCHVLGLAWLVPPQSMFLHNKCPIWPQYPCFRLLCRRTHKCPQPLLSALWPVSSVTILAGGLHQSLDELSIVVSRCHVCPEEQRVSSVFVVAQVDLDRDKSCWHSSHRGKVFVSGWRLHCGAVFNRFFLSCLFGLNRIVWVGLNWHGDGPKGPPWVETRGRSKWLTHVRGWSGE